MSAGVARAIGIGFLPLRLVSLVSALVIFWFVYRLAQRDTGSDYAGVVATGLFAATYRIGGAWLDLARNDSLFLALTLAAIYLLRFHESRRGALGAGLLLALAALTKQTALIMVPPLLLYAALIDWRRAAIVAVTTTAALAVVTWAVNARTHGWFVYYVVHVPQHIQMTAADPFPFWARDIVSTTPIAVGLAIATLAALIPLRDPHDAFWPLVAASGIGAAWLSRLHAGAYDNVLIPAYISLALLAGIAGRRVPERLPAGHAAFARIAIAALCTLHMAVLHYSMTEQTPSVAEADLARQLGRRLAGTEGEVLVPSHSFVPTPAGPVMHAHSWALTDVLRAGDPAAVAELTGEIKYALDQCEYRMIVLDKIEPWMEPDLDDWYRPAEAPRVSGNLWTRTGYHTRPRWIYVPKAQCPAASEHAVGH